MALFYLALGLSRLFRGRCAEQSHADDHPVTVYAYIMRPITKTGHQVSVCFDVVCGYIYAGQWHGQQSQSAGRSRGCREIENRKMLGRVTGTNCELWGGHGRGWSGIVVHKGCVLCGFECSRKYILGRPLHAILFGLTYPNFSTTEQGRHLENTY